MMKILIITLLTIATALPATLAQSNQVMDFLGIEIGADWQSVSNQHPEAELSNYFRHWIKYDAPFKIYTIQVRNLEYPFVTNAEVAVYQDTISHATFRVSIPSTNEYSTLKSEILTKPSIYLTPPINIASHELNTFMYTNRMQPIRGSLSYEGNDKAIYLEVGFDSYQVLEEKWRIYINTED